MDEQPIQLHAEVREPIPEQPGRRERDYYEYRKNGFVCGFMFTEPPGQWRRIAIAETRTKKNWARQVQHLLEADYPDAEKVILVCDNLNMHVPGAFYETFPPEKAIFKACRRARPCQLWDPLCWLGCSPPSWVQLIVMDIIISDYHL